MGSVSHISVKLEQFRSPIFVGIPKFANHFNVLPVVYCLRNIFALRLDENIKLTSSFSTSEVFATLACMVNTSSVGQKLLLEAEYPVQSFSSKYFEGGCPDSINNFSIKLFIQ